MRWVQQQAPIRTKPLVFIPFVTSHQVFFPLELCNLPTFFLKCGVSKKLLRHSFPHFVVLPSVGHQWKSKYFIHLSLNPGPPCQPLAAAWGLQSEGDLRKIW